MSGLQLGAARLEHDHAAGVHGHLEAGQAVGPGLRLDGAALDVVGGAVGGAAQAPLVQDAERERRGVVGGPWNAENAFSIIKWLLTS